MIQIDTAFDFTTDTSGFWDGFWERNDGLGGGGADPDSSSPTLQKYHRSLWSKELPNGKTMNLQMGSGSYYLTWEQFRFGSDSIIASLRYRKYGYMIEQVKQRVADYQKFYEDFLHKSYTIGGTIIFPKHPASMNQNRGTNRLISDRWDLTLECIRRYYVGEHSPLSDTIERDKVFFDLFLDFKGYVDFFLLQDAVSSDYTKVHIWCGNADFSCDGLPQTIDEYFKFLENELAFLEKRNSRISDYCTKCL